jgi:multidrug resistance efflux pump
MAADSKKENGMKKRVPARAVIGVLVVGLAIVGYYGVRALNGNGSTQLKASGTIETVSVNISPELSGRVLEVKVDEGQSVKAGDELLVLDGTLLEQQRKVAEAGLESARAGSLTAGNALDIAKAQYQQVLEAALAVGKATRLQDWFSKQQQQFDQPNWYFARSEQVQAMQAQVDEAQRQWDAAKANLAAVSASVGEADFLAAEQRLLAARVAYQVTKDVDQRAQNSDDAKAPEGRYNSTHCGTNDRYVLADKKLINVYYGCSGDQHLTAVSQQQFEAAKAELTAAQQAYDELLNTKEADDMLEARAEVQVAQERYYAALDRYSALQIDDQSPAVTAAQGTIEQAQGAYEQSQKAVAEAQANLDLLEAQLGKLKVYAPMDGVILTRSVEPGEYVQPGAAALTMGDIRQLTITVYVPEDRYGEIHLGQAASVKVDSFPEQTFDSEVTYISDQAEFTPRNVQTAEGRSSTVYAIKLTVTDPQDKLKPGMPADVTFVAQ